MPQPGTSGIDKNHEGCGFAMGGREMPGRRAKKTHPAVAGRAIRRMDARSGRTQAPSMPCASPRAFRWVWILLDLHGEWWTSSSLRYWFLSNAHPACDNARVEHQRALGRGSNVL